MSRTAAPLGLLALVLAATLGAPIAGGQAEPTRREAQLTAFRDTVSQAVDDYAAAHANFTQADNASAKQDAREAMVQAGREIGQTFLRFEQGHGDNASLSVFMQTEMPPSFYRAFEQDIVLLRATMVDAETSTPPAPSEVERQAGKVQASFDRVDDCLPDGCQSAASSAGAQSFFVLVREGLEAILLVGAITAYLHKTDRGHKAREVYAGVGAALVATLVAWLALDQAFQAAAQAGLSALVEATTMLLAAALLFYISFWLLSKTESKRWRKSLDGKVEQGLAENSTLALAGIGFLAVFREGLETVLFMKAITLQAGAAWTEIAIGSGLALLVLGILYYAVRQASVRIPLRPFFAVTSAVLGLLALRFTGIGVFEFRKAGALSVSGLSGVQPWLDCRTQCA